MRADRAVLAFSLLAAAYFAFLALDFYVFKLDSILLDVVRETGVSPDFDASSRRGHADAVSEGLGSGSRYLRERSGSSPSTRGRYRPDDAGGGCLRGPGAACVLSTPAAACGSASRGHGRA